MSNIADVYTAVTAYAPTGTTTSRNISAVELTVANADLPCRLLLPNTNAQGEFIMIPKKEGPLTRIRNRRGLFQDI